MLGICNRAPLEGQSWEEVRGEKIPATDCECPGKARAG